MSEAKTIPMAINRVRIAVFAIYFTLPLVALSALPVHEIHGTLTTKLALTPPAVGFVRMETYGMRRSASWASI